MNVLEFWEKIGLPKRLIEKTLQLNVTEKEYNRLYRIYQEDHESFFLEVLKKENCAMWFLWIYSHMACEVHSCYIEQNIPEEFFWDTFQDIAFWCDNYEKEYGQTGLGEYGWFTRHIDMTLFRLGRLQFEVMEMEYGVGEGLERIEKGTPIINIHIPQGEPLIWQECEKSLKIAREWWGTDRLYVCHSWLLYPQLDEVLSEQSNIREFRKHFKVLRTDYNEREAEWRIYGKVLKNIVDYPEETGLQKRVKEYLLRGKCLGNGWAILK